MIRAKPDHLSRGPVVRPVTRSEARSEKFEGFTFSLTPGLVYRLEERMRARKDLNRSVTLRAVLEEALS